MIASFVKLMTHILVHARRLGFGAQGWLCTQWRRAAERLLGAKRFAGIPHGVNQRAVTKAELLNDAWVLGADGSVADASGELLSGVAPQVGFLEGWAHPVMKKCRGWNSDRSEEAAVLLSGGHARNYYHWLFEVLPRMIYFERAAIDLDETLVLAPTQLPFQRESLACLGLRRVRSLAPDKAFRVGRLWCTPPAFSSNLSFSQSCPWLRERLLREGVPGNGRKILLKRRQGKRAIVNFDELEAGLAPLGFEVIAAEELSFREQIELFAAADTVVAAHGAGLANVVFCRPGTRVVEIISEDYLSHLYRDISLANRLAYSAVVARAVGRPWELREGSKQLLVDLGKVEAALSAETGFFRAERSEPL